MDGIQIIKNEEISYSWYKTLLDKYLEIDSREIVFQNRVIMPLFDRVFINTPNTMVVDISTQYKNKSSKKLNHDILRYRPEDGSPPDFLLVTNWKYRNNSNPEIKYHALVEIKSPIEDPIYNKDLEAYPKHTKEQINNYLYQTPIKNIILTDGICWDFYFLDNGIVHSDRINLKPNANDWVAMKRCELSSESKKFYRDELNISYDSYDKDPEEWETLLSQIKNLVL